ncbi:thiamine-phosphate kinase [Hyaloraphidium curvatum]|nr:thiamine-phosphate kinase [Hyaloraphidium curvatum]
MAEPHAAVPAKQPLGEFELISKYFTRPARRAVLGVGDDCALLAPRPGRHLAVSTDMLVSGRHFFPDVDPERLGKKCLAAILSDLAACGAEPLAFTLAISIPEPDEAFLAAFARGLVSAADSHDIELVGGDTTKGPLAICITVLGDVPIGAALLRSGAGPGDDIWVSGVLGDARLALDSMRGLLPLGGRELDAVGPALETLEPRIALGVALRGTATSAIDLSDGLFGDLAHILERSAVGATVVFDSIPRSDVLAAQPANVQKTCVLSGGDDYELLFTASPESIDTVLEAGRTAKMALTRIGRIEAEGGLRVVDADGVPIGDVGGSYNHFRP